MNMMHYDIVKSTSKLIQGTATLYVAIKVMEQIKPDFPAEKLVIFIISNIYKFIDQQSFGNLQC